MVSKALTSKNGTIASKNGDLYRFIVDLCWRSWLIAHMMNYGNLHDELEGWCPSSSAKLVNMTNVSLGHMVIMVDISN